MTGGSHRGRDVCHEPLAGAGGSVGGRQHVPPATGAWWQSCEVQMHWHVVRSSCQGRSSPPQPNHSVTSPGSLMED